MEPRKDGATFTAEELKALDPASLSYIDRISWFERQKPMTADNDNAKMHEDDSACFDSWAIPDYMRN